MSKYQRVYYLVNGLAISCETFYKTVSRRIEEKKQKIRHNIHPKPRWQLKSLNNTQSTHSWRITSAKETTFLAGPRPLFPWNSSRCIARTALRRRCCTCAASNYVGVVAPVEEEAGCQDRCERFLLWSRGAIYRRARDSSDGLRNKIIRAFRRELGTVGLGEGTTAHPTILTTIVRPFKVLRRRNAVYDQGICCNKQQEVS